MKSLRTLLLATDFGPTSHAIAIDTAHLARAFSSRVTPLHVVDIDSDSELVDYYRRQVGQLMMEPLVTTLTQERVELAHPVVLTGPVADRILRQADEIDADLIVMGAGELHDDGTVSPGPITEAVIQRARQPVMAIRPGTTLTNLCNSSGEWESVEVDAKDMLHLISRRSQSLKSNHRLRNLSNSSGKRGFVDVDGVDVLQMHFFWGGPSP